MLLGPKIILHHRSFDVLQKLLAGFPNLTLTPYTERFLPAPNANIEHLFAHWVPGVFIIKSSLLEWPTGPLRSDLFDFCSLLSPDRIFSREPWTHYLYTQAHTHHAHVHTDTHALASAETPRAKDCPLIVPPPPHPTHLHEGLPTLMS